MIKSITQKLLPFLGILLFVGADQYTKLLAVEKLKDQADYPVIPNVFSFSYLENTGAAFSSFTGQQTFLIILTSVVMLLILWKYLSTPSGKRFLLLRISFLLIISGGIGNLIDRILNGYVVDFLYFIPINFPKFNLADCFVCIGMGLLGYVTFFYYKDDELDFLFRIKTVKTGSENE